MVIELQTHDVRLGVAYKFDIIEWVPYLGFRAGYFHLGPAPLAPYRSNGGSIGAMGDAF